MHFRILVEMQRSDATMEPPLAYAQDLRDEETGDLALPADVVRAFVVDEGVGGATPPPPGSTGDGDGGSSVRLDTAVLTLKGRVACELTTAADELLLADLQVGLRLGVELAVGERARARVVESERGAVVRGEGSGIRV